jgi:hypothetical protein
VAAAHHGKAVGIVPQQPPTRLTSPRCAKDSSSADVTSGVSTPEHIAVIAKKVSAYRPRSKVDPLFAQIPP